MLPSFTPWNPSVNLQPLAADQNVFLQVLGALWAYLFLGERWGPAGWVGASLIIGSSFVTQVRRTSISLLRTGDDFVVCLLDDGAIGQYPRRRALTTHTIQLQFLASLRYLVLILCSVFLFGFHSCGYYGSCLLR